MKGNFFSWFRSVTPVAIMTDRMRIKELIERHGFACVNIKSKLDTKHPETVFVLEIDELALYGQGAKAMIVPDIGTRVWRFGYIDIVNVVEPGMVPVMNGTRHITLKAWVEKLSKEMQYDERFCIYQARGGERVYINGGFNLHKDGFTGLKAYPTEQNPDGVCGAFVSYKLVPFYNGEFFRGGVVEQIPNFTYYQWMGNRVRNKDHLKPMQVDARAAAIQILEPMIAAQRELTRDMETLLTKLKQAQLDVHE